MTIHEQIEKLRKLERAATPGPWSYDGMHSEIHAYESDNGAFLIVSELREHPGDKLIDEFGHAYNPNFDLIAEMRNALPELLDGLEDVGHAASAISSARDSAVVHNELLRGALGEAAAEYARLRAERDALMRLIESAKPCQLCDCRRACEEGGRNREICAAMGFEDFELDRAAFETGGRLADKGGSGGA